MRSHTQQNQNVSERCDMKVWLLFTTSGAINSRLIKCKCFKLWFQSKKTLINKSTGITCGFFRKTYFWKLHSVTHFLPYLSFCHSLIFPFGQWCVNWYLWIKTPNCEEKFLAENVEFNVKMGGGVNRCCSIPPPPSGARTVGSEVHYHGTGSSVNSAIFEEISNF